MEIPNRARPATVKPITAPPRNASGSARWAPSMAAWVVRALALVAMSIPTKPAVAEKTAPHT